MSKTINISEPGSDGIVQLQLNRPADRNAFNEDMHREFSQTLAQLRSRTDIRVILLHATGGIFSAGGNFDYLRQLREDKALQLRTHQEGLDIVTLLNDMPVPIVAAVQGHAMGIGATIITSCDIIVAYKDAKIGDPHVVAGLVAGDGGVFSWSAAAGATRAKRMLLTGQAITASQANTLAKQRLAASLDFSLLAELASLNSEDLLEALAAISEKRKGNYKNR
jgi:enoyl-CoA hydratase